MDSDPKVGNTKDLGLIPFPKYLRYDPENPPKFSLALNVFFGIGATVTVANLYYNQSILVELAQGFSVSDEEISQVATLTQVGYALGILFVSPLGDLVPRRALILVASAVSCVLSVGLALSKTVLQFKIISFFAGVCNVAAQILIPLTGDLAPAHRRSAAISITWSGLLIGQLISRVIAGIIAAYVSWRYVYYMALGLQGSVLIVMWFVLPDYPSKNVGLTYLGILKSILSYIPKYPVLIQTCIISALSGSVFSGYWTVLTFLLTDVYSYNSLDIGLFGIAGLAGICSAPFIGKLMDRLLPWVGQATALLLQLIIMVIALTSAKLSVVAIVIVCFTLDVGLQVGSVACATRVYSLDAAGRSRLNAVLVLSVFLGQIMGTAVQSKLYSTGGWYANSGFAVGCLGLAMVALFIRGPHATGWFGWSGDYRMKKELSEEEIESRRLENEKQELPLVLPKEAASTSSRNEEVKEELIV